jgi:hypothetical protein
VRRAEYVEMTSQLSQTARVPVILRLAARGRITDNPVRLVPFLPVTPS